MVDVDRLHSGIAALAPNLTASLSTLLQGWVPPIIKNLDCRRSRDGFPKIVNDPVWGVIELYPWEVAILDSPLLQRLRGIRQLGFAHTVYPGASHSRLEHTLGVVEASERMMRALARNASHHKQFGKDRESVPDVEDFDRYSTRLAALLHDLGHGPFSHATEEAMRACASEEFDRINDFLREELEGVTKIAASETLAVLIVLSNEMKGVFEHRHLEAVPESTQLAAAVAARILGSRSLLKAGYLSGVVSGPLDADKLDYMGRDSHHSGLPVGLDIDRLISKLEVVVIRPDNAPDPDLRVRAEASPAKRIYEMGISLAGVGAYEQMIIGRVILYDRLYHHHKIRAAESMVRLLIRVSNEERRSPLRIHEFLASLSDESFVGVLGGLQSSDQIESGGQRAATVATALLGRQLYHRTYAFAARFISGLEGVPDEEKDENRALLFDPILRMSIDEEKRKQFEFEIYRCAKKLAANIPGLSSDELHAEEIIIDLPQSRAVVTGNDILTRTETGDIAEPSLFFDPERWAKAYEAQKIVGYVLAPRHHGGLVAAAASIVFYEQYMVVMNRDADRASKSVGFANKDWIRVAAEKGLCSPACLLALTEQQVLLAQLRPGQFRIPNTWQTTDPSLTERLAQGFNDALPAGLPATVHEAVVGAIDHLTTFVDVVEKGGMLAKLDALLESKLQEMLKNHLRSREVSVIEGSEFGGGETDLLLPGSLVIENKVRGMTADPFAAGTHYDWQVRRYSLSVVSQVSVVLLAYQPTNEAAILPLTERIRVFRKQELPENHCFIRVVIPWGYGIPSTAPIV
jgi:HD superfamily phosphohydrolase